LAGITTLGDICTGHGCWPPRPCISASNDVIVNGRGIHRRGDSWAVHCKPCGKCSCCHGGTLVGGSSTVFANGRQAGRLGDPISCGSLCSTGSPNVNAGG